MVAWSLRIFAFLVLLFLVAFWQMYLSSRPPLTTDPDTLGR